MADAQNFESGRVPHEFLMIVVVDSCSCCCCSLVVVKSCWIVVVVVVAQFFVILKFGKWGKWSVVWKKILFLVCINSANVRIYIAITNKLYSYIWVHLIIVYHHIKKKI